MKNSVEERRKTQESEKRLSENRATYNKLIDEAVAFENKGDKKNAYEKYKKAAEMFPDGSRHSQKHIEELKKAVEIEINIEQAEAAAEQAEKERKEKAKEREKRGLQFLLDKKVNSQDLKIDKWQAGVGRVTEFVEKNKYNITENDISNFVEWVGKISIVKKREKMDFEDRSGNSWKRLENVFGERTDEIFNSINNQ